MFNQIRYRKANLRAYEDRNGTMAMEASTRVGVALDWIISEPGDLNTLPHRYRKSPGVQ